VNLKVAYFNEVDKEQWDSWVASLKATSYHHSWAWLDYSSKFQNVKENRSFACLDTDSSPLAICPLMLSTPEGVSEISVNGAPVGVPALAEPLKPSVRRRLLDAMFGLIHDYAGANDAGRIVMVSHPITRGVCAGEATAPRNSFELLRYRMLYRVENTVVIDLKLSDEILSLNLSKYQRRHITRGRKKNIRVKVFNGRENKEQLEQQFNRFQEAHLASAGKMTRPQATWDSMYNCALEGKASLFCAFLEDAVMSFLFCGEFSSMAFGWSQVNLEEFEKAYSPRHILEWEAISYYKRNGFTHYEVGERFYCPQLLYVPTAKEITISVFKERYGGFLLPKITWLGYYDEERLRQDLKAHHDEYLAQDNLIKSPEEVGQKDNE